ncbi:MAG: SCO1664 family protein [Candidatus Nanopelagicales bacterium]
MARDMYEQLLVGELDIEGRLWDSSNSAMRVTCVSGGVTTMAVYKPQRGERPLWDFPTGTLGRREVATAAIDAALGWGLVPVTVWREEAPLGPGSLQAWVDVDTRSAPVDVIDSELAVPPWIVVAEGEGARGDHVCLVHEDTEALRRISLLDAIVNNADRKGGHVLRSTAGAVVGIDHGLTFHIEPKLRTVLWGWAGQAVDAAALEDLRRLRDAWVDVEGTLGSLLSHAEIDSAYTRLESLIEAGEFPSPDGAWPSLPWPAM